MFLKMDCAINLMQKSKWRQLSLVESYLCKVFRRKLIKNTSANCKSKITYYFSLSDVARPERHGAVRKSGFGYYGRPTAHYIWWYEFSRF